jgi:hypothetical protein
LARLCDTTLESPRPDEKNSGSPFLCLRLAWLRPSDRSWRCQLGYPSPVSLPFLQTRLPQLQPDEWQRLLQRQWLLQRGWIRIRHISGRVSYPKELPLHPLLVAISRRVRLQYASGPDYFYARRRRTSGSVRQKISRKDAKPQRNER